MEHWWNDNDKGKPKYLENTFPTATLSTTNPILNYLELNPDPPGERPTTSGLSHSTAFCRVQTKCFMLIDKNNL
jgi:hypothetical protein